MDVPAVHRYVVERPNVIVNGECDSSHDQGSGEISYRRQEKPLPARFSQLALVNPMEKSVRECGRKQKQNNRNCERRHPECFMCPEHGQEDIISLRCRSGNVRNCRAQIRTVPQELYSTCCRNSGNTSKTAISGDIGTLLTTMW